MDLANDWFVFLRGTSRAIGIPLIIAGLVLMLIGWRMWKVCVMLSYGLLGAMITATWVGASDRQWLYSLIGGALLALLSYWPVNYAVAVLGGLAGGALATQAFVTLGLGGTSLWITGWVALVTFTAYSLLYRQHVVIIMTSSIGAFLLVSGASALLMAVPSLYSEVNNLVVGSTIVMPFLLLVPTVASCFYQFAEVRRLDVEI